MRPLRGLVAFLGAPASGCPDPAAPTQRLPDEPVTHTDYGKLELSKALIAERGAEPTGEQVVAELEAKDTLDPAGEDPLRVAVADLAVRRRFIASLEACKASGRWCSPWLENGG